MYTLVIGVQRESRAKMRKSLINNFLTKCSLQDQNTKALMNWLNINRRMRLNKRCWSGLDILISHQVAGEDNFCRTKSTAYLQSKQLLPFDIAEQISRKVLRCTECGTKHPQAQMTDLLSNAPAELLIYSKHDKSRKRSKKSDYIWTSGPHTVKNSEKNWVHVWSRGFYLMLHPITTIMDLNH